ncbi:MAG: glycosyltransferase [Chitinivibrionales bacterium]|nr:glycosyltransferase [Chitinivibrionales bacterium]
MRVGMLAPIAWRTPPRHYGPWERVTSLLTEELVRLGVDVTLFATADSVTGARLQAVCPAGYEENRDIDAKVWECLHIAHCFEHAPQLDIIHNQFDFLPLSYSRFVTTPVVTTIHGFSSPRILPAFKRFNDRVHYVSISDADRAPELDYVATVYHGIDIDRFRFHSSPGDYLLFFGRIHPDKGAADAIEIARQCGKRLVLAGIVQDPAYFEQFVRPHLDGRMVEYIGSVGPERRDSILGNALALLHPIHFNEPFGLSVVEAMACGTPVVAYARGSMPEIITDGIDGRLVESVADAVEAVRDIDRIDRRRCRYTVEQRFTARRMASDYLRVYESILRAPQGNRHPVAVGAF